MAGNDLPSLDPMLKERLAVLGCDDAGLEDLPNAAMSVTYQGR
jgi:hypothetical protein